jgi:hypothetical protein
LMALGVFTYSQYAGLSPFSGEQARPVAGQPGVHK